MSIDKLRAQIIAAIWKAVAQSEVDLSAVPAGSQEKLVASIADQLMVTMDTWMDQETARVGEAGAAAALLEDPDIEGDEQVIWQGRPFLSLVESYTLTSERLKIVHGLFARHVENYELIRIQDIDLKQDVGDRVVNVGDILISGHDSSDPDIVLRNVSKPEAVFEVLRKAWMEARKRHGLQFREYM